MYILYSKETCKLTEVSPKYNKKADLEFQGELEIADDDVSTVSTPNGTLLTIEALMTRTGAFTVVDGGLVHDDKWTDEI